MVLVNHNVFETVLVSFKHIGVGQQNIQGIKQNVAEIDAVQFKQALLITLIDFSQHVGLIFVLQFFNGQAFVLPTLDTVNNCLRRVFFVVNAHGFANLFDDAFLVVSVQNGKIGTEADQFGVVAQNFDADAVKGAEPDGVGHVADHFLHAFFHFAGGAVGKGDDQAVPGVGFHVGEDISQAGGEHFGFAGAGT